LSLTKLSGLQDLLVGHADGRGQEGAVEHLVEVAHLDHFVKCLVSFIRPLGSINGMAYLATAPPTKMQRFIALAPGGFGPPQVDDKLEIN
jgi:hypothetical protein